MPDLEFTYRQVETIPQLLNRGVLYHSKKYEVVVHLCACGCDGKVITPIAPPYWRLSFTNGKVSLTPSIGNWRFACKSHYWIKQDRIVWAEAFSEEQIQLVHLSEAQSRGEVSSRKSIRDNAMKSSLLKAGNSLKKLFHR
jgi:hypothetical protein